MITNVASVQLPVALIHCICSTQTLQQGLQPAAKVSGRDGLASRDRSVAPHQGLGTGVESGSDSIAGRLKLHILFQNTIPRLSVAFVLHCVSF